MFLPVLLVRDYGLAGWLVFAIPNVIGAAAMGWTVRDRAHSTRQVRAHRDAMATFSIVTLAFQVYFAAWYLSAFFEGKGRGEFLPTLLFPVIAGAMALAIISNRDEPLHLVLAAAVYGISLICMALFVYQQGWLIQVQPENPKPGLWALAMSCAFGFAFCPYLDLTFHDARHNTGIGEGRAAFGVGFGLLFLIMIFFSLLYARNPIRGFTMVVAVHIILQLAFTSAVHSAELWKTRRIGWLTAAGAAAVFAHALGYFADLTRNGELCYRLFMSFYGLIFPAYVWLCMLPTWNNPQPPTRRMWMVLTAAVIVAAPMFWLAFIAGKMGWAAVGVVVVLLARLSLTPRRGGGLTA